jgi:Tetratricopeptide repeat
LPELVSPIGTIQGAILDGLAEVTGLDVGAAVEVGDGAGNLQDAVVGACRETQAGDGVLEELLAVGRNGAREALPFLQQALAIRHDFPEAIATLASLQIDLGQIPRGVELVRAALAKHASSPELHNSFVVN